MEESTDVVRHSIEGLIYLLVESSKLAVSDIDFLDSILSLGFTQEMNQLLLQLYHDHRAEIRRILGSMAAQLPHYHNLEWRVDVQVAGVGARMHGAGGVRLSLRPRRQIASRLLHQRLDPIVLLKLETRHPGLCAAAALRCAARADASTVPDGRAASDVSRGRSRVFAAPGDGTGGGAGGAAVGALSSHHAQHQVTRSGTLVAAPRRCRRCWRGSRSCTGRSDLLRAVHRLACGRVAELRR